MKKLGMMAHAYSPRAEKEEEEEEEGKGGQGRGDLALSGRGYAPVMSPSLWALELNLEQCPGKV